MREAQLARAWSSEDTVDYYIKHRDKPEDLYKSETRFLEEALRLKKSVIDIGCAAGGFSHIVKGYNKNIKYTGTDISRVMIEKAKGRFPEDDFRLSDGRRLNFADGSFDAALSFGVLHMTEWWKQLFLEAWRVCRQTFLFDLRIVEEGGICDAEESYQKLEFGLKWDGVSKAPYVVVGLGEVSDLFLSLRPRIGSMKAYGYRHPVSRMTVSGYKDVCMSVFLLEKGASSGNIEWELPMELPRALKENFAK